MLLIRSALRSSVPGLEAVVTRGWTSCCADDERLDRLLATLEGRSPEVDWEPGAATANSDRTSRLQHGTSPAEELYRARSALDKLEKRLHRAAC